MADPGAVDLGVAFGLPPREAVAYLRSKGYRISWNWRDTWQEAHDRAFTVAKMTRYRLLSQTRQIVDDMLAQGLTVEQAAREMEGAFRRAGWWGRRAVTGADGQTQMVQLGSMRRIRTILRTNMHVAYNAGRRRRQAELAGDRPYWRYVAIRDASTRQSHLELHGTTLPHDDPAWEVIYPPNGFNCRCRVRAITELQARRDGQAVSGGGSVADVEDVNPDTGEITPLRRARWTGSDGRRSFTPDPGWGYAPGTLPPPSQTATVAKDQPTWRDLGLPDARALPRAPAPPRLPEAPSRHDAAVAVEEALGLSDERPSRLIDTPTGPVLLSQRWALHITEKRDHARERYANRILPTLEDPDEVWMTRYDNATPKGEYRTSYIKAFADSRNALSIVTELEDGSVLYNFMPRRNRDLNSARIGALVYPSPP